MAEIDWKAHWRGLIESREEERDEPRPADYWSRRAAAYHGYASRSGEPFLEFMEPYLSARRTLIDVGAGTGRYAVPLADRLDWVTAVEPSDGMRELISPRPNLTLVASTWEDAEVAPADLVIACHVVQMLAEPLPFIEKMEAAARERVFVLIRDRPMNGLAEQLREALTGKDRPPQPLFGDLFNLLRQAGIQPDVTMLRHGQRQRFDSMESALEDCRYQLGALWNEDVASRWLQENLDLEADGAVSFDLGERVSGVAHFAPRSRLPAR